MNIIKLFGIAAIAYTISSCASSSNEKVAEGAHDTTTCTEHNHGHAHDCESHNHEIVVVGVAQQGDYKSGEISIKNLDGEIKNFDYKKSNQDQIAAWQAGDTVSIFIDHHHHGEEAHDSITAIKIGNLSIGLSKHDCEGHNHDHDHHGHNH